MDDGRCIIDKNIRWISSLYHVQLKPIKAGRFIKFKQGLDVE